MTPITTQTGRFRMTCLRRASGRTVRLTYDYRGLRSLRSRTVVVRLGRPKWHLSMLPDGGGREAIEHADALEWLPRRPQAPLAPSSTTRPTSATRRCAARRPGRPDL